MNADGKNVFQKIIDGELPAKIIHNDADCIAFHDIAPHAPVHFLVVPKAPIRNLDDLSDDDAGRIGRLMLTIRDLARKMNLTDGYRVITNCGADAGQTVDHLHFHVLGGKKMGFP